MFLLYDRCSFRLHWVVFLVVHTWCDQCGAGQVSADDWIQSAFPLWEEQQTVGSVDRREVQNWQTFFGEFWPQLTKTGGFFISADEKESPQSHWVFLASIEYQLPILILIFVFLNINYQLNI